MSNVLSELLGPLYDDISYFGLIYEGKEYEVTGMQYNLPDVALEEYAERNPLLKLYSSIALEIKDKDPSVVGTNDLRKLNPLEHYYTNYILLLSKILSYISDGHTNGILETKRIVLNMESS